MKQSVTLVFDIGKTTKKALLFDEHFNVLDEITECFPEITDDHGFPCENLTLVSAWTLEILRQLGDNPDIVITHVNFSAYGASLVYIDDEGQPVLPFYNYLKPCPEDVRNKFYNSYITDQSLLTETASPWLGFLNSGVQLYWMKYCSSNSFARTKQILHLPQFFSFLLTGKYFNEKTSLGCHTMLWDFHKDEYHSWVKRESLTECFPPVYATSHYVDHLLHGEMTRVGIGVHDSSAALMPYLVSRKEPFLMLSTGTWNICFNPWNKDPLTQEELDKDCLSYMTYDGKPVKASRIFLGHEHEVQQRKLAAHFNVDKNHYKTIAFDEKIYRQAKSSDWRFHPMEMEGTGPLPAKTEQQTNYSVFPDFVHAQHRLMIDLASWQKMSIDLVDKNESVSDVIVVGGFSKSNLFLEILKREIPGRRFYLSDHPRASALGAAWLVHEKAVVSRAVDLLKIKLI